MPEIAESVYAASRKREEFFQQWQHLDAQLTTAREYLELLEADPATDELPIVIARHELLLCNRELASAIASED